MEADADAPTFPPLLRGQPAPPGRTAFQAAVAAARAGTDAGLIVHDMRPEHLSAAVVLAPECPLEQAMGMVLVAANGFGDAFGARAPAEVAIHFEWPGAFRVNGARCGGLRAAADTRDPAALPGWLVIGLEMPFLTVSAGREPGETPDHTALWEEGCGDITPPDLLEAWARHFLTWVHEWETGGMRRVHQAWTGRAHGLTEAVELTLAGGSFSGRFSGLDEGGGMLLKGEAGTQVLPLSLMLEEV